jgi:hypothetical protein
MIGVGYVEPFTKEWIYKNFTVSSLSLEEENRICKEFSGYICKEADWYDVRSPLLMHWASAENSHWDSMIKRQRGRGNERYLRSSSDKQLLIPNKHIVGTLEKQDFTSQWFDMLKLFKSEPIVIKGSMGFGLKDVAGALYKHGFITTKWDGDSSCVDGTGAMIGAYNASLEAKRRGISMKDMPQMKDIERYNEVDCKVLADIIQYLRGHKICSENFGEIAV